MDQHGGTRIQQMVRAVRQEVVLQTKRAFRMNDYNQL